MKGFVKDPDAVLDYTFDWGPWLNGDEIDSSNWTLESGITRVTDDIPTTSTTRIFVSGGTAGQNYTLTNRVVTTGGRTDDRSFEIRVRQR